MQKIRVAQWNTGNVGKLAMQGILDDPRYELVGVYAHSPEKAGVDAGPLCGRPDTGVKATNDIDAILAAKPDVVVYTPFTGDVDELVKLLENGVNVLSTKPRALGSKSRSSSSTATMRRPPSASIWAGSSSKRAPTPRCAPAGTAR